MRQIDTKVIIDSSESSGMSSNASLSKEAGVVAGDRFWTADSSGVRHA